MFLLPVHSLIIFPDCTFIPTLREHKFYKTHKKNKIKANSNIAWLYETLYISLIQSVKFLLEFLGKSGFSKRTLFIADIVSILLEGINEDVDFCDCFYIWRKHVNEKYSLSLIRFKYKPNKKVLTISVQDICEAP